MGKKPAARQPSPMWVTTADLPTSAGHPFFERLNQVLEEAGFDAFVEGLCAVFYASRLGRPSLRPGRYFRLLFIGYFEGLSSERGIAWRVADSLSLRAFLDLDVTEAPPNHSTLSRTRRLIDVETHVAVFTWVLERLAGAGLVQGKTVGVDATTLEANAAMRSIERRDTGESYEAFVRQLAKASGIETPTRAELARFDRSRKDRKTSNKAWQSPQDRDAKTAKMKDGRTHLAHKAEHGIDLETGAILSVTVQEASEGDSATLPETLTMAAEQVEAVQPDGAEVEEVVADKGYHSDATLVALVGAQSFAIDNPGTTISFDFSDHGLSWAADDTVAVKLKQVTTNTPPAFSALHSVSIADATETDGELVFKLTLNRSTTLPVLLVVEPAGGTATDEDYYPLKDEYPQVLDPGVTDRNVTVHLKPAGGAGKTVIMRITEAWTMSPDMHENRDPLQIERAEATGTTTNSERQQAVEPLTASFVSMPPAHDGESPFAFELLFSEEVAGLSYVTVRDALLEVTGGRVTGARRLARPSNRRWEVTVEPSSPDSITIALAPGSVCDESGVTCNANGVATMVRGPAPLTASFEDVPASHDGEQAFTFGLTFSEDVAGLSFKTLRDRAFTVTGGAVRKAQRRQQGSNEGWTITVDPDSHAAVTIRLPAGAVETADGRGLARAVSATVAGPVGIAVADARVDEGAGAVLAFAVTLSRAASGVVTVDYATTDGSAHAGDDYTAASGTLTFQTGESSQTIEVAVRDDAHDEGEETLTLRLSNASGGRVTDGEATGTIENHDPMPRALLARFGRTAAVHVVEHVEERLQAPREPGFRGRFAGRELRRGMERDIALNVLRQLGGMAGATPTGAGVHGSLSGAPAAGTAPLGMPGPAGGGGHLAAAAGPIGGAMPMGGAPGAMGMAAGPMGGGSRPDSRFDGGGLLRMGLGGGDVLTGSAFALNRETRHGGILSFWSRGAQSRFSGREGALSLGGDVRTTMVGADYAKGPVVAGLSLSRSLGLGEYAGVAGGQVASSVTGLYPWLGYKATDRVTVWGVAGYGAGGLLLTPEGGPALESGLSMAMAAAGTRGELISGGAGGFALAFKTDALWVGTSIAGVDGPEGRLKATEAAVTRLRTGLEGSRAYTLGGRLSLKPSVEVGLRHDGGDAETGAGMDVGGGLVVSDSSTGLAVDLRVRMLVMHQAEGFRERGMAVSLSYNPTPSTPLGLVARVAPSWGGQATSGAEALWGRETMGGMSPGGVASGNRLDGEVGYGLPVGSRFVGTPRVGFSTSEYGRDYRAGYGLGLLNRGSLSLELGIDAQRRESPLQGAASNGVLGRATLGW